MTLVIESATLHRNGKPLIVCSTPRGECVGGNCRCCGQAERIRERLHELEQAAGDLRTIDEWAKECGVLIYDPDGFDRSDPHLYERKMTRAEFNKGLPLCTIAYCANCAEPKEAAPTSPTPD